MDKKKKLFSRGNIWLFSLLLIFWFILSPEFSLEVILVGSIVSFLVVLYSQNIVFTEEEMPLYYFKHIVTYIKYIGILLVEIVKANIDVALIVLNPSLPIQPQFVSVPMMLKNDVVKVIYGNFVTLTPGTLTVDIKEDEFIIHALTDDAGEGMYGSILEKYARMLEENQDEVD